MKKEINRTLGNNLRCILPSFWWKRLLGMIVDKIDSAEDAAASAMNVAMLAGVEASNKQDELVSGSNIKTINGMSILGSGNIVVDTDTDKVEKYKTKEELDAVGSTDGGEIAAVVDAVLVEKSFTECYQPTSAEISTSKYNTKFTKVDGLALNPDFNPNLISSNYGRLIVVLYSDGKSKGYHKGYPSHLEIECDYNRRIICWEYDGTSGSGHSLYDSSGFYASTIDRVNNILREGNFRFSYFEVTYKKNADDTGYTYYYSYNDNFPSDATAMIDNVVKMLFAETQNADIYVRSSEWVRLLKEGDVTGGAGAIIDSELSTTSKNAVQNKVVTAAIEELKNSNDGIISRTVYPTKTIFFGSEKDNEISETEREYNCETFRMVANNVIMLKDDTNMVVPLLERTEESATFGLFKYQAVIGPEKWFIFASYVIDKDGNVIVEVEMAESEFLSRTINEKAEIREFYTGDSLTEEQKAWNLETAQAILDKKAIVICNGSILGDVITTNNDGSKEFTNSAPTPQGVLYAGVKVEEDGTASVFFRQLYLDDKLSDKSISAVQNKVVTAALNNKVDKSDIKTINGESILGEGNIVVNVDTSNLATKEELNSKADTTYVDTAVSDKLQKEESDGKVFAIADGILSNTDDVYYYLPYNNEDANHTLATKGDIETLTNDILDDEEVLAHALNELNDRVNNISEELSGDFASKEDIETLAAADVANQEAIESVSGSVTTLSERVDNIASELTEDFATKEEMQAANESLTNELIDDEEVLAHAINDLNDRINELAENVSGEAATKVELSEAVSTINETINANDERYEDEFSALDNRIDELAANVSGETVTKVEFEETITDLTNEVINDEEVLAHAINDLKSMVDALTARVNALESNNA